MYARKYKLFIQRASESSLYNLKFFIMKKSIFFIFLILATIEVALVVKIFSKTMKAAEAMEGILPSPQILGMIVIFSVLFFPLLLFFRAAVREFTKEIKVVAGKIAPVVLTVGAIFIFIIMTAFVSRSMMGEERRLSYDAHNLIFRTLKMHPERLNEKSEVYILTPISKKESGAKIYKHSGLRYKAIPLTQKVLDTLGYNFTLTFKSDDGITQSAVTNSPINFGTPKNGSEVVHFQMKNGKISSFVAINVTYEDESGFFNIETGGDYISKRGGALEYAFASKKDKFSFTKKEFKDLKKRLLRT